MVFILLYVVFYGLNYLIRYTVFYNLTNFLSYTLYVPTGFHRVCQRKQVTKRFLSVLLLCTRLNIVSPPKIIV